MGLPSLNLHISLQETFAEDYLEIIFVGDTKLLRRVSVTKIK